jgi:hypothetical protein
VSRRPETETETRTEEPPPIGGSWRRLYAIVIGFLAFQILVYWLFTRAFK